MITEAGCQYNTFDEAGLDSLPDPRDCAEHGCYDEDNRDYPSDEHSGFTDAAVTENLDDVIH